MVRSCRIDGCSITGINKDRRIKFSMFRFPPREETCRQWLELCRLPEKDISYKDEMFICSRHFEDKFLESTPKGRKKLTRNATPTLFPWNNYILHTDSNCPEESTAEEVKPVVGRPGQRVLRAPDLPDEADPYALIAAALEDPLLRASASAPVAAENFNGGSHSIEEQRGTKRKSVEEIEVTCMSCVKRSCPCPTKWTEEAPSEDVDSAEDRGAVQQSSPRQQESSARNCKILQQKLRRTEKRIESLEEYVAQLKAGQKDCDAIINERFPFGFARLLSKTITNDKSRVFTTEEREMCVDLYRKSVAGYHWIKQFVALPNETTVKEWVADRTEGFDWEMDESGVDQQVTFGDDESSDSVPLFSEESRIL